MSENCPKCGSESRSDSPCVMDNFVAHYWKCGSKQINGKLLRCGDCREGELRNQLAARESELAEANERLRVTAGALVKMESELAEAQRRVAELEAGIQEYRRTRCDVYGPKFYLQDTHPEVRECKAWAKVLALLPPDRITHIPGKEDHDGEMH